jgi:hypothetical protein
MQTAELGMYNTTLLERESKGEREGERETGRERGREGERERATPAL